MQQCSSCHSVQAMLASQSNTSMATTKWLDIHPAGDSDAELGKSLLTCSSVVEPPCAAHACASTCQNGLTTMLGEAHKMPDLLLPK